MPEPTSSEQSATQDYDKYEERIVELLSIAARNGCPANGRPDWLAGVDGPEFLKLASLVEKLRDDYYWWWGEGTAQGQAVSAALNPLGIALKQYIEPYRLEQDMIEHLMELNEPSRGR